MGLVVGTDGTAAVVLVVDMTGAVVVVEMGPGAALPTVVLVDVARGTAFPTPSCAGCVTVTVLVCTTTRSVTTGFSTTSSCTTTRSSGAPMFSE